MIFYLMLIIVKTGYYSSITQQDYVKILFSHTRNSLYIPSFLHQVRKKTGTKKQNLKESISLMVDT